MSGGRFSSLVKKIEFIITDKEIIDEEKRAKQVGEVWDLMGTLHRASKEAIEHFNKSNDVKISDDNDEALEKADLPSLIRLAVRENKPKTVKILMEKTDEVFAISLTVEENNFEMIELILNNGSKIAADSPTFLQAVIRGNGSTALLKKLLDAKADVNFTDSGQRSLLSEASRLVRLDQVSLLLDHKPKANWKMIHGYLISDSNDPNSKKLLGVILENLTSEDLSHGLKFINFHNDNHDYHSLLGLGYKNLFNNMYHLLYAIMYDFAEKFNQCDLAPTKKFLSAFVRLVQKSDERNAYIDLSLGLLEMRVGQYQNSAIHFSKVKEHKDISLRVAALNSLAICSEREKKGDLAAYFRDEASQLVAKTAVPTTVPASTSVYEPSLALASPRLTHQDSQQPDSPFEVNWDEVNWDEIENQSLRRRRF